MVCAVCAFCVGAEVQEETKVLEKHPGVEVWTVRERIRWTSTDGERFNETVEGTLRVEVHASGYALEFQMMYDVAGLNWEAFPPTPRLWNDFGARRPYAVFEGDGLVGQLKLNRNWTKANGKITYCRPSTSFGISWHGESRVRAQYLYYLP